MENNITRALEIPCEDILLFGDITIPESTTGLVIFAHGSGSSRFSSRNRYVAEVLQHHHLATLLFDLLTPDEEIIDQQTAELRFNIPLLAHRLITVTDWIQDHDSWQNFKLGYFGASTGAAAALIAAAARPKIVNAVVSRGGRVDLAEPVLKHVQAPALFIVGALDNVVLEFNQAAQQHLSVKNELKIIPAATHLFEEPGALEQVAEIASEWFRKYL